MKFKFIILEQKVLKLALGIILILIVMTTFVLIYFKPNSTKDVFTSTLDKKTISYDLNGDGKNDTLYLKPNTSKYDIEINIKNKIYSLECNKKLPTLGKPSDTWPVNITIADISRDRIPEIFIQSSENTIPVQHIFTFDNEKYKDIFCSSGNVIGFLDYKNNKTPKFISGLIANGTIDLGFYILSGSTLQNYSFNSLNLPGRDSIVQFISYLESLPYDEAYKPSVFFDGLSGNALYVIGKISAECSSVKFLDGLFYDTKWNKDGSIAEIKWILNLKGPLKGDVNTIRTYTVKLTLVPDPSQKNQFKINQITL